MRDKKGVSLLEVAAVVSIMGILSALGVSKMQRAVANAKVKDAAYNISSFLEHASNEARRMSTALCVKTESGNSQKLLLYKAACNSITIQTPRIDSLLLDVPNKIIGNDDCTNKIDLPNFEPNGAQFAPRQGLSSAPVDGGFFAVQYGSREIRSAAIKYKKQNKFEPSISFDDCEWSGI